MKATYDRIIDVDKIASLSPIGDMNALLALAKGEDTAAAASDEKRTLLLAIDVQNDFMEDIGSLAVQGSRADVQRLTEWMYRNLHALTHVMCSLDCHTMMQIFHPDWWINEHGEQPTPFTIISHADVKAGRWRTANGEEEQALEYLRNLEAGGKKQLCIWPYHCLEGTTGAQLEAEFTKMLYFHAAARKTSPTLIYKGQDPYTEMYGIIKAEYDKEGFVNQAVLDAVATYDEIYLAGQASSHCVLASTKQILEYFGDDRSVTSRITLLEDCMSPIAGFEEDTLRQFEELKSTYGIQIKKSAEVHL